MFHSIRRKKYSNIEQTTPKTYLQDMAARITTSDIIDAELYKKHNVKRGLRNSNGTGVVVGLTKIGEVKGYDMVDGKKVPAEGRLFYRGYEIQDLVNSYLQDDRFGFEEVTYLLIFGDLPTAAQLKKFKEMISEKRTLPDGFARDMILTAPSNNIMNKLARSILALYCYDKNPDDTSVENVLRQSIDLIGYFPALIAYAYQARQAFYENKSLHLHFPISDLSTAENVLRMIRPTGEYTDMEAKILDLCFILHAEHGGGNNSSFTTHLVTSSGTDTYAVISAAVGSLKGPRHGGANISVIHMINDLKAHVKDISNHKQVDEYLTKVLRGQANDGTGLIYGMGHAVYTLSDPRAKVLKSMAKRLAKDKDLMEDFALCDYIEQRTPSLFASVKGVEQPMCANLDLYSGFVYNALNIPVEISTPFFALSRLSGWSAHRLEELITGKKLMRPAYVNVQERREFIPLKERADRLKKAGRTTRNLKELQQAIREASPTLPNTQDELPIDMVKNAIPVDDSDNK